MVDYRLHYHRKGAAVPVKSLREPSYSLHRPTGQARVRIQGKDHYLGAYGSPESRERYDDLIAEWSARRGDVSGYGLTVDDLALLYLQHAEQHYRKTANRRRNCPARGSPCGSSCRSLAACEPGTSGRNVSLRLVTPWSVPARRLP